MQNKILMLPELSLGERTSFPKYNLPIPLTSFVGRQHIVTDICTLLRRLDIRLLTLAGTAGVGKTRLGLQVAIEMSGDFVDGVCFVPLAAIGDPNLVIPTIARQLQVQEVAEQSLFEQVTVTLQEKQILLVLDNFEQVVEAASQVEDLLVVCPRLKVIITSRAVLRLQAEHIFPVLPLPLPDLNHFLEPEVLSQYAAVTLFTQRAQALSPSFSMTLTNAPVIAEICVRLDGLPLAIELAATRIRLLSPQTLLTRLSQRLQVLTKGTQDMPARQQTLRNTIQWSYDLLTTEEQRLFRHLCAFVGGFTVEEAEAVGRRLNREVEAESVSMLDLVEALLDKSLLLQIGQEGGESHLYILETIREYGLECLHESGEEHVIEQADTPHYLTLAEHILADEEPLPTFALTALPARTIVSPCVLQTELTPREMDVLRLLARGLTSAQIAEQLVIGLVTVNSHVRSIYSKLGVSSRSAATRYAMEHYLL